MGSVFIYFNEDRVAQGGQFDVREYTVSRGNPKWKSCSYAPEYCRNLMTMIQGVLNDIEKSPYDSKESPLARQQAAITCIRPQIQRILGSIQ